MNQALGHPLDSDPLYWPSVHPWQLLYKHKNHRNSRDRSSSNAALLATTCLKILSSLFNAIRQLNFGSHPKDSWLWKYQAEAPWGHQQEGDAPQSHFLSRSISR